MNVWGGAKAWRDIWGAGEGIGAVDAVAPAGERISRLRDEYARAVARVTAQVSVYRSVAASRSR